MFMNTQIYRASVAAIIVNEKKEFLLTQLNIAQRDEYDFVKGGMDKGETEIETLKREIKEELGDDFTYEILKRSELFIVYEWPEHLKKGSGFRGQARVSYFVFFKSGKFKMNKGELKK
jgi:putative (di)nucleoside polyphosphate hydrolase